MSASLTVVALRKESVDRNIMYVGTGPAKCQSLSARRAWIEIFDYIIRPYRRIGRSPQGERG